LTWKINQSNNKKRINEMKVNKPITIKINELKSKIINICNESELPPAILDLIMQGIYLEIHNLAEKQLIEERAAYTEAINNELEGKDEK
jgi:hypothetical protein